MRRILFEQTDFASLPNPPAGFNYIGFNGATFSQKDDGGNTTQPGGGLVQLTYSESLDLLDAKGVKEGTRYLITGFDVDLYGGTDILVDGLPNSQFSPNGYGKFYNPNYGEYSTWDSTSTYVANDIVIYGGKIWKNLTGSTGETDNILGGIFGLDRNWELQSDYTNTLHYILVWDQIQIGWSSGNYCINSRFDSFRNNFVRIGQLESYNNDRWFFCEVSPIAAFGWGNDNINDCTITDSYFSCLNIINSEIYGIKFENYSFIFDVQIKDAYIESCQFTNESGIYGGSIKNCQFTNITLINNSTMYGSIYGGSFNNINLNNSAEMDFDVYNSNFNHINLDNNSYISSVSATNSYYEFVNMSNDSWTDNFTLDNSSIRRINLSNRSYLTNIYLYDNSEMYEINLDNYSYLEGYNDNIKLYSNSYFSYINLNNHCRISGSIGLTNSSYFKRIDMTNRSMIQDNITFNNSYIEKLDATNDSYIYDLNFTNNSYITNLDINNSSLQSHTLYSSYFDSISVNNSSFSNMGLSNSHISTIDSYGSNISDIDLTSSNLTDMSVNRSNFSDLTKESSGTLYQLDLNTFYLNLSTLGTYSNTFPSGSSFRFNEIKYQFFVEMVGSYGKGLADTELIIPNMLIPSGYYIEKIILDTTSDLIADTLPDFHFGVFDETSSLTGFDLSTLTSVKVFDINNLLSGNKANTDTKLYASLSGGTNITSGTITMEVTLKKTYDYYG